jgi:hypothetical protein
VTCVEILKHICNTIYYNPIILPFYRADVAPLLIKKSRTRVKREMLDDLVSLRMVMEGR